MYKRISMLVRIGFRFLLAPGSGHKPVSSPKIGAKAARENKDLMNNSLHVICSIDEAGLPQGLSKLPGQVNPAA